MSDGASGGVRYRSTRASRDAPGVTFEEALLRGLAPDGGLYLPDPVPPLPHDWAGASSLAALAAGVLAPLVGATAEELAPGMAQALAFPLPLRRLPRERYVLELFHGPTLAFKDVGARGMARLVERARARRGGRLTILVATSGDTGSAVADAFAGLEGIRVALLYPEGRVSALQERQIVKRRPGVRAFAVDGTFDDCQRLVKGAFADPALAGLGLSSANSINIGRLLPQTLYYLWGSIQLARLRGSDEPPLAVIPSGNLGNLTGGVLAARMGWPVRHFLAAHNANRYFPDFLAGRAQLYDFPATVATVSNAMDVGAPSNFERLYRLLGPSLADTVSAVTVDDTATIERMRLSAEQDDYLPCPHTAVGLEAVERYRAARGDHAPALVLATAHPAKFPDAVRRATGAEPPVAPALEALTGAPRRVRAIAATPAALRGALSSELWD